MFNDIISLDLAKSLNLKYRRTNKKAGTADRSAKCDITGRVVKPLKIHLENIPGGFLIQPYVIRNLAHPINLGQNFLRRNGADLLFRANYVTLNARNGVTRLTDKRLDLTRSSLDKRIQRVIDLYATRGKNPSSARNEILQINRNIIKTHSPLVYNNTRHRLYTQGKQILKGMTSKFIPTRFNSCNA